MDQSDHLTFGPFRLDLMRGHLLRDEVVVPLRPRTFSVLRYLAEHPNQVVTAEAMYQQVWQGDHVSRSALRVSIREIRTALGESAQAPTHLETVYGQGYRFVSSSEGHLSSAGSVSAAGISGTMMGRQRQIEQLSQWMRHARAGSRQLVLIGGEVGMGKTTLVDTFLGPYLDDLELCIGRGQCIEHYGEGEAYLPVLEALGRLGRASGGERVIDVLRQMAPSWLPHLPALIPEVERQHLRSQATTPQQMLRALSEALEALSVEHPLILVLEDLHWSDPSTIDWLTSVARRREAAKLLIIGTYRPPEVHLQSHALVACLQELRAHGQVAELTLTGLGVEEVAAYGHHRLGAPLTSEANAFLQRRSSGNALFLVHLLEHLMQQGDMVRVDGHWALRERPALSKQIPEAVHLLLARQLGQLPPDVQHVLEVASVVGETFSAAAVAAGVERELEAIDRLCSDVVRLDRFLEADGLASWPDGTTRGQYRFRHALVRQVAYERIGEGPRAALHARIGERLEKAYWPQVEAIATTLAVHFFQGHDVPRAIHYLRMAAQQALSRSAYPETITHCTKALGLLPALPETSERAGRELDLLITLRSAIVPTQGERAPEVAALYRRSQILCDQLEEGPQRVLALGGVVRFYWHIRTEVQPALEVAQQQCRLAQRLQDPILLVRALCNLGPLLLTAGAFAAARDPLEQAIRLCDTQPLHTARSIPGWLNYVAASRGYVALALWHLGYPDQALGHVREGLTRTRDAAAPFSLTLALAFAAELLRLRGDTQAALEHAESLLTLATEQDYPHWVAIGTILRGAALAKAGRVDEAIPLLQQGIEAHRKMTALDLAHGLSHLAEAYGQIGRLDEGLTVIAEALALVERTGEQADVAELHRLQGELLWSRSLSDAAKAESCFQHALDVARTQQSQSLELRAATSVSRLWHQQGRRNDARDLLASVYHEFTEGFDTADWQGANSLLAELQVETNPAC